MRELKNVRLHLVGHADSQPLSERLTGIYGDNQGLSRERAGEVAEFLQKALGLPPEAISFEWAGDTAADRDERHGRGPRAEPARRGRGLVRRERGPRPARGRRRPRGDQAGQGLPDGDGVQAPLPGRCKRARAREEPGRAAPLRRRGGEACPRRSSARSDRRWHNLQTKQNVTVKFIGFTDDAAARRAARSGSTELTLRCRRRMAYRVRAGDEGRRSTCRPRRSRATAAARRGRSRRTRPARGRALNRRVEVEFWYDDPLQELPDEPQLCPDAAGAEVVTKVYDPPCGRVRVARRSRDGQVADPAGLHRRSCATPWNEIHDKANVRLRFVGHTRSERLDRRTALVYGDDVGCPPRARAARWRRSRPSSRSRTAQVEHEGRGYVHSDDVVNSGFVEGEHLRRAGRGRLRRASPCSTTTRASTSPRSPARSRPKSPLGLNLMRITVDGEPIDDPGRSSEDIQRCTDVALDAPTSASASTTSGRSGGSACRRARARSRSSRPRATTTKVSPVRFKAYNNYAAFIDRSEIRIFERDQSPQATPLAVVAVGNRRLRRVAARSAAPFAPPVRELSYVCAPTTRGPLRRDRAAAAPGAARRGSAAVEREETAPAVDEQVKREQLAAYGASTLATQEHSARQRHGEGPGQRRAAQATVWLAGEPVPVDENGNFEAEAILPAGTHTVEVALLDEEGTASCTCAIWSSEKEDWFYAATADLTLSSRTPAARPRASSPVPMLPTTSIPRRTAGSRSTWTASSPRPGSSGPARTRARDRSASCSATSWTSRPSRCSGASIPTTTTRPTATTAPSSSWRRPRASSSRSSSNHDSHALLGQLQGRLPRQRARPRRPRAVRRKPPLRDRLDDQLRREARGARRLRRRAGHGAEPRGVPRDRRLALLPAPARHPDGLGARADRDARPGLRTRDERGAAAAVGGLRHRLPPGSRPALRAAHRRRGAGNSCSFAAGA